MLGAGAGLARDGAGPRCPIRGCGDRARKFVQPRRVVLKRQRQLFRPLCHVARGIADLGRFALHAAGLLREFAQRPVEIFERVIEVLAQLLVIRAEVLLQTVTEASSRHVAQPDAQCVHHEVLLARRLRLFGFDPDQALARLGHVAADEDHPGGRTGIGFHRVYPAFDPDGLIA